MINISNMGKEFKFGRMEQNMMDIGIIMKFLERESSYMQIKIHMMATFLQGRPMDMALTNSQTVKLTKEVGRMTNLMVKVSKHLETVPFTKETSLKDLNRDMVSTSGTIILPTKAIGKLTSFMERVNTFGLMVDDTEENGKRVQCMAKENLHMKMGAYIKVAFKMI